VGSGCVYAHANTSCVTDAPCVDWVLVLRHTARSYGPLTQLQQSKMNKHILSCPRHACCQSAASCTFCMSQPQAQLP
jgi:hypothetical protein